MADWFTSLVPHVEVYLVDLLQFFAVVLVGGYVLRLSIGLHNASFGPHPDCLVEMPPRGKANGIIALVMLFHLLFTWAYVDSFARQPKKERPKSVRAFDEEEQQVDNEERDTRKSISGGWTWKDTLTFSIAFLRFFIFTFTLHTLTRLLLPTTPWRAFLITGNCWLIASGILLLLYFVIGLEYFLVWLMEPLVVESV